MTIPSSYKKIVLNNAPSKEVNLKYGEELSTFRIEETTFDKNSVKEMVIKSYNFLTIRPKGWMQKGLVFKKNLFTNFRNDPVITLGLVKLCFLKSSKHSVGDKVTGRFTCEEYIVANEERITKTIDESLGLPLTSYLSSVGMDWFDCIFRDHQGW